MNQETLALQHQLMRVRAYLESAKKVTCETTDPEEKADAAMLSHLYQQRAEGLGAEIEWADCQENGIGGEWARQYEENARYAKEQAADLQKAVDGIGARIAKREAEKAAAAELKKKPGFGSSKPIIWKKTEVRLAAEIAVWWQNGSISGYESESDAIEMCSAHFVVQTKNGDVKPIDPKSIVKNYKQTKG